MVTVAIRVQRKRLAAAAAGLALAAVLLLWGRAPATVQAFLGHRAETKCATAEDGAAWLREQGWEVDPEPTGLMAVLVPARFDQLYERYKDIQKAQGFDISRYKGERVMKYTYLVKNYPQEPEGVAANLLVYQGKLIGADLCSLRLGGFLRGASEGEKGRL